MFLKLHDDDNVLITLALVAEGSPVPNSNGAVTQRDVAMAHKVADQFIASGMHVLKYGLPIGVATQDIQPGEHVHIHNLKSSYTESVVRDDERKAHDAKPV